ncbi:MAG: molybdenum cofactor guanylyltransferase [Solirubrobacterales bacterium]|nr:molybdenum cofactor guanylyltransferase [Solirubrobacterales bacterium]
MSGPSQRRLPLGAVLAGGAAARLGGAKATAELAGRPLISYPLEALAQAGIASFVVAKADSSLPALEVPIVTEPDEPRHPLAGVVAALAHAGTRGALVLPCDAPFVSPTLLRVLASAKSTTGVRSGGRIHPLFAFYSYESLEHLESATEAGDSATDALEDLDPDWIEAIERETFNVNSLADLARAEDLLRQPRS